MFASAKIVASEWLLETVVYNSMKNLVVFVFCSEHFVLYGVTSLC